MAYLSVKLDHIATLRQARRSKSPVPAQLATLAEMGGADGIAAQGARDERRMRQDRRQEAQVRSGCRRHRRGLAARRQAPRR